MKKSSNYWLQNTSKRSNQSLARQFMRDYLLISVVPVIVLLIAMIGGALFLMNYSARLMEGVTQDLNNEAEKSLRSLGEQFIEIQARDVASQLAFHLQTHPEATIADLQASEQFKNIAVQPVGETGYTAVYDSDGVTYFHINPDIVGMDMHELSDDLPDFWAILETSLDGTVARGYYDWQDPDGTIREKFMVNTPVGDTSLRVAATTYIDEFSVPIVAMQEKAGVILDRYRGFAYRQWLVIGVAGVAILSAVFAGVSVLGQRAALHYIRPIEELAEVAVGGGQGQAISVQTAILERQDEIGTLAVAFSRTVEQLQETLEGLKKRTHALETSAQISRRLTTILDRDELLQQVVTSLRNAFGYYHVHVYLIDKNTGELIMREGSGEVGRQLKSKDHKLQPGQGIVGTVARSGEAFLTENVADVPYFVRNPLLPETQAELAVPVRKGHDILGVLDLQSQALAEFGQEELTLMQSIADQLAVALENARLFEDAQAKAAEAERLSRRLTREVWQALGSETPATGYTFTKSGIRSGSSGWLPAMDQALQRQSLVQYTDDDNGGGQEENNTSVAIPLRLRGEVIGAIGIERPADQVWTEAELSTVRTVTDQISRALENARLSKEQEKTIVQLKEVDRLKSEFLTSMSHELRTPLNSIIGFADVLLQGIDGELNELALNDIQLIYNSGQHLLALINDILDISKIEAGMMELICEPIDIEETVNDVLAASGSLVKERSVEIVVDIEADAQPVFADKLRLNQVLLNLVSNAAKFTHVGTITIQARVDDRSPDKMRIAVIDTGIGIPPEQMDSIFDRFRQADSSTTREYGGTGLGLAICRQLVEMHGGSLDVESEEGVGSEFCFTIPLAKYKLGGAPSAPGQGD